VRLGFLIVCMAVLAVTLVHIRRSELVARHQIQRLEAYQVRLRRTLWRQERDMGYLTAPAQVRRRAMRMALIPPDGELPAELAGATAPQRTWQR